MGFQIGIIDISYQDYQINPRLHSSKFEVDTAAVGHTGIPIFGQYSISPPATKKRRGIL
jgi:hypothetical protein